MLAFIKKYNSPLFLKICSNQARIIFILIIFGVVAAHVFAPTYEGIVPKPSQQQGHASVSMLSREIQPFNPIWSFLDSGSTEKDPRRSRLELYEDGKPLGPAHSKHNFVREKGEGRFSHWRGKLYFSASDNSIPATNGREYTLKGTMDVRVWVDILAVAAFLALAISFKNSTCFTFIYNIANSYTKLFTFIIIFGFCIAILPKSDRYLIDSDTGSYMKLELASPWKSIRSPGYPFFLYLFSPDANIRQDIILTESNEIQNSSGSLLVKFQTIILASAIAAFAVSLLAFISWKIVITICILSLCLVHPVYTNYIMTESLSQACIFALLSCLIMVIVSKKWRYMIFACFIASFGFLLRPALVFLLPVTGIFLLYLLLYDRKKLKYCFLPFITSTMLLFASMYYPVQLYIQSGLFSPGTLSGVSKIMFATFLAQPDDIQYISNTEAQKVLTLFFEKKEQCDAELLKIEPKMATAKSLAFRYSSSVNQYGWKCYAEAMAESSLLNGLDSAQTNIKYTKIANATYNTVISRHKKEFLSIVSSSFISAFGLDREYRPTYLGRTFFGRLLFMLSFFIIIAGCILGDKKIISISILCVATHIMHILALSYGHAVLTRYSQLTESIYLVGIFLAAIALYQYYTRKNLHGK